MKKSDKKKWCAALRSGKYKQGRGRLVVRDEEAYCCLGVAAEVLGDPKDWEWTASGWNYRGATTALPAGEFGLSQRHQHVLVKKNDTGLTFEEIAEWIEKNL